MHVRAVLVPIFCIVSIACGDEAVSPPPGPMAGTWTGRILRLSVDVSLVLSQTDGINVTGTGTMAGRVIANNGTVAVNVGGTCPYPSFSLDLFAQGFSSAQLKGTLVAVDSADATLDLSGFIGEILPLKRK